MNSKVILGIDTSNYTTSLALTDQKGAILLDKRTPLAVKQGERGLRQSYALFQHMENLPPLIAEALDFVSKGEIAGVAVSNKPRPQEGSYMPVFKAGMQFGRVLSKALCVPYFEFSHQEGHLVAAKQHSLLEGENDFLAYHLSGGTSELLKVENGKITIVGGSKDISFGQLLDRIGVAMNLSFPAGSSMDETAIAFETSIKNGDKKLKALPKSIPIKDGWINLSGLETHMQLAISSGNFDTDELVYQVFLLISRCLLTLTVDAAKKYKNNKILFTGGVSASRYLRASLLKAFSKETMTVAFSREGLSSDNAVGISLLGGRMLWP